LVYRHYRLPCMWMKQNDEKMSPVKIKMIQPGVSHYHQIESPAKSSDRPAIRYLVHTPPRAPTCVQ
jgi:hypothetical protein